VNLAYVARRLGMFALVVWAAMTVNFFIPRLPEIRDSVETPDQPVPAVQATPTPSSQEGERPGPDYYARLFRLDRPLHEQYLLYLGDMARLDFGYSMSQFPNRVQQALMDALPWTLGLLGTSTLIAFSIGTLLGAILAWPSAPGWLKFLTGPLLVFSAVPFYLLGLVLDYVFGFLLRWLPMYGAYPLLVFPAWSWEFIWGALRHAVLPASAIILSALAFWALGMRAMVVTEMGEDYMVLAEAKGLRNRTLLFRYAVRNALLPQSTALALSMGNVVTGAILVEIVFAYPGIGSVLRHAILHKDYFLLQGVIFCIILAIALATLVLDLALPLLDPRIAYRKA